MARALAPLVFGVALGALACGIERSQHGLKLPDDAGASTLPGDSGAAPPTDDGGAPPLLDAAPPAPDGGGPIVVATGLSNPTALVVTGGTAYWIERNPSGEGLGVYRRVPGEDPAPIYSGPVTGNLWVDEGNGLLYFTSATADGGLALLYESALDGTSRTQFSPGGLSGENTPFNQLYGGYLGNGGSLLRVSSTSSVDVLYGLLPPGEVFTGLRSNVGGLFFTASNGAGTTSYEELDSAGTVIDLWDDPAASDETAGFVAQGDFAYIATSTSTSTSVAVPIGAAVREARPGGVPSVLVSLPGWTLGAFAADSTGVFLSQVSATLPRGVYAISSAGLPKLLAESPAATDIALHPSFVYWLDVPDTGGGHASLRAVVR
jgi:hypothetical protein